MCENSSQNQNAELMSICQVTPLPAALCTVFDFPGCHLSCYSHTVLYVDSFFYFKNKFDASWMEEPVSLP